MMIKYKIFFVSLIASFLLINISCVKDVTVSPEDEIIPQGKLIVQSVPAGAMIYLNDRNTGQTTPDTLIYLNAGKYNVKLKIPYFRDSVIVTDLGENESKNVMIDFMSNPTMLGSIFALSEPQGAQISLNDSSLNKTTPYKILGVKPGLYRVKFSLSNYRESVSVIEVVSNNLQTVSIKLRDTLQWIDYQKYNSSIPSNFLTTIISDKNGVKWIGSSDKGLIRFDEKDFSNFNKENSPIPSDNIISLAVDNANKKWIGTPEGLAVFDNSDWKIFTTSNSSLPNNRINSITIDNNNIKWLGTPSGIVKFDDVSWKLYDTIIAGKEIVLVNDIVFGNNNDIWFTSVNTGVGLFIEPFFIKFYYDSTSCLFSNKTDKAAWSSDGEFWLLANKQVNSNCGVNIIKNLGCFSLPIGTENNLLEDILIDKKNTKWICSREGLYKVNGQSVVSIYNQTNSQISSSHTKSIIEDSNGVFWITTQSNGLNKFKP